MSQLIKLREIRGFIEIEKDECGTFWFRLEMKSGGEFPIGNKLKDTVLSQAARNELLRVYAAQNGDGDINVSFPSCE